MDASRVVVIGDGRRCKKLLARLKLRQEIFDAIEIINKIASVTYIEHTRAEISIAIGIGIGNEMSRGSE